MRPTVLLVVLAACSSSHPGANPDAPITPGVDAVLPADGAVDAPLAGNACPSQVSEVKRLVSALSPSPYSYKQMLAADFDHDSQQDIALVEVKSDSANHRSFVHVKLFLQTTGDFGAPVQSEMIFPFYGPEQIVVGDFNGDHLSDLLISYTDTQSAPFQRTSYVYIATQQANHTFTIGSGIDVSACRHSTDERLFALGVLDVDRDGYDDVLTTVSYDGLGANPAGLSLLRGGAGGLGFATCVRSATTTNAGYPADLMTAQRLAVADFDGDGHLDVLGSFETNTSAYRAALFRSTAASQFTEASGQPTYDEFAFLGYDTTATGGISGLIALSATSSNSTIKRYAIDATGVAAGAPIATLNQDDGGAGVLRGFAVRDFNGDGLTDVVEVGYQNYSTASATPVTFSMACDRTAHWETSVGSFPAGIYHLRAIDFAGHADVVAQDGATYYDLVVYHLE